MWPVKEMLVFITSRVYWYSPFLGLYITKIELAGNNVVLLEIGLLPGSVVRVYTCKQCQASPQFGSFVLSPSLRPA